MVNDTALDPAMKELPIPPPEGVWTEMTLPMNIFDCSGTMRQLYRMVTRLMEDQPGGSDGHRRAGPSEAKRQDTISRLRVRVETRLAGCNPAIPIQRLALQLSRLLAAQGGSRHAPDVDAHEYIQLVGYVLGLGLGLRRKPWCEKWAPDVTGFLADAIAILEMYHSLELDELLPNFRAIGASFPQTHALLYALWHLFVQPEGDEDIDMDHVWHVVNGGYIIEEQRLQRRIEAGLASEAGPKWRVLKALREKVIRRRGLASGLVPGPASADEPARGSGARPGIGLGSGRNAAGASASVSPLDVDNMFDDEIGWAGEFMDWKALADDLGSRQ